MRELILPVKSPVVKITPSSELPGLQVPTGFEKYLGNEPLLVKNSTDLLPGLLAIDSDEAKELASHLQTLSHLELVPQGSTRRDVVLMQDTEGNSSMVVICRDRRFPKKRNRAYGDLAVIGGCGIYDTPKDKNPLKSALAHTKLLSIVMARKCFMAGLELGGMKATIPGESDWEKSEYLQKATGFLFSQRGVFKDAITGTDVRQTPETIANMAKGSEIGGNHQIAGMIPELDTPASCRFSLEQTYEALQELYGLDKIPDLKGATVLIEGFGRIGRTAVRLMLEKGTKVVVSDPLLTNEDELLPNLPDREKTKRFLRGKLKGLEEQFGKERVRIARIKDLYQQKGEVFIPCSSNEGSLTEEIIEKLASNGIKVILSGANNPFGQEHVWERANSVAGLNIIMPPETLTNCGSVTAASMEPLLRAALKEDPTMNAERFANEVVSPHIAGNTREKLGLLVKVAKNNNTDLYTAGEIVFRQVLGSPFKVEDGILTD